MTVCCFPKAIILLTVTAVAVPGETTSLVARCSNMALSVNMKIQLERSLIAVNRLAQSFLLWSMWLCLEWLYWSKCSCMTVHLGKIRLWQDSMQEKKKTKLSSKVIVLVMIWESKKSQTEVYRLMLFTFHGLLCFWQRIRKQKPSVTSPTNICPLDRWSFEAECVTPKFHTWSWELAPAVEFCSVKTYTSAIGFSHCWTLLEMIFIISIFIGNGHRWPFSLPVHLSFSSGERTFNSTVQNLWYPTENTSARC